MSEWFTQGLILPALALVAAGWIVPRLLARIWPEGLRPLLALGLVATLLMLLLSALAFLALYIAGGMQIADIAQGGAVPAIAHFLRLGLLSALLWAPVLILSLAATPRTWVREIW